MDAAARGHVNQALATLSTPRGCRTPRIDKYAFIDLLLRCCLALVVAWCLWLAMASSAFWPSSIVASASSSSGADISRRFGIMAPRAVLRRFFPVAEIRQEVGKHKIKNMQHATCKIII